MHIGGHTVIVWGNECHAETVMVGLFKYIMLLNVS